MRGGGEKEGKGEGEGEEGRKGEGEKRKGESEGRRDRGREGENIDLYLAHSVAVMGNLYISLLNVFDETLSILLKSLSTGSEKRAWEFK